MARRIVRTIIQLILLSGTLVTVLFFLDIRYSLLPTRIHNLLPEHHAGQVITDITYESCPSVSLFSCATREGWVRIDKDLFLGKAWLAQGYIQFKRMKKEDLNGEKVIVDIRIKRSEPAASEGGGDAKWESRPGGIWIKRSPKLIDDPVTGVDVLFGPDAAEVRPGWVLREGSLTLGESPRITVRKGAPPADLKKPVLKFRADHKFKIIQVSDLHLSTGVGACRHPEPAETADGCEADPRTLEFVGRILDEEKPDFAVLSGDQVNGDTAPDAQTAIFKFAELFVKRKIPYATILGNHDDEGNLSREDIMKLTASLPYSLSEVGPALGERVLDKKGREGSEGGVGNYHLEVLAHKGDHSALTIYFVDTHAYSPDKKEYPGYNWVKPSQINWFKSLASTLKDKHDHNAYSFVHLDMAFIHIPLPEYRLPDRPIVGGYNNAPRETPTAPSYNSGFKDVLVDAGVSVVSAGHDHANEYCLLDNGKESLWMCYAGGSGFGGYGGYGGYQRRVRLFEINAPLDRITTWKRVERGPDQDKRIDEQILVEGGKAAQPK
ncbi:Metallo-dependent phosphatase [Choiromyces venosus 120613-1]|uniref:Metallo-dependent phosphatase n=1 Tax=Choiromyces venosus 120613-1 TaxID=1336337 RepID=A0A3N4K2Q5_9PEZI|nr:Metallo-dependent phosphatase [Choiromyces venosus 120613-1]